MCMALLVDLFVSATTEPHSALVLSNWDKNIFQNVKMRTKKFSQQSHPDGKVIEICHPLQQRESFHGSRRW